MLAVIARIEGGEGTTGDPNLQPRMAISDSSSEMVLN